MCERRPCPRKTHAHEEMTYEKSLCPRRDHVSGSRPCPRRDDIPEEVMSKKRSCSRRAHVQEEVMFKKRHCQETDLVNKQILFNPCPECITSSRIITVKWPRPKVVTPKKWFPVQIGFIPISGAGKDTMPKKCLTHKCSVHKALVASPKRVLC